MAFKGGACWGASLERLGARVGWAAPPAPCATGGCRSRNREQRPSWGRATRTPQQLTSVAPTLGEGRLQVSPGTLYPLGGSGVHPTQSPSLDPNWIK